MWAALPKHWFLKTGGQNFWRRRDKKFLICHVTSSNHMRKESYELMYESLWLFVTTLTIFWIIGIADGEIARF